MARKAGVSNATVSRVLNGMHAVSSPTRLRVLSAIKELNYYPDVHGRSLSAHASRTLGLVVSNLENPFFLDIFRVLQREAHSHGYDVLLANTGYDSQHSGAQMMLGRHLAGLALVVSEIDQALLDEMRERQIRTVVYDAAAPKGNILSLKANYGIGIHRLVGYLRSLGHRKIAFLGHRTEPAHLSEREKTFVEVLNSSEVQFTIVTESDGYAGGRRATQQLFSSGFKPSAILCANDCMAIGALRQLRELGLEVPRDVSVAGFDNISLSEVIHPSLTTLHISRDRIGRWIFEGLIASETDLQPLQGIVLQPELVVRESTGLALL